MCILLHKIAPHLYHTTRVILDRPKDMLSYRSKLRSLIVKKNSLTGRVDNHHVIPQQFRNHNVLSKCDFDINCSSNIVLLPNKSGIPIAPNLKVHTGGHRKYNRYVLNGLNDMSNLSGDELRYIFWLFIHHLKNNIQQSEETIPWN